VDLLVDGIAYQTLTYGTDRTEQCETFLSGTPGCPNIGFEGEFDTTRLHNGLHSLTVRVRDSQGRAIILPRQGGMNVFVEN
jgi:hypothetical protein